MQFLHDNWRTFLTEGTYDAENTSILREISDDELGHIERALDEMEGEDLAFNTLFQGKNRVLLPFSHIDTSSELGQFLAIMTTFYDDSDARIDAANGHMAADFKTGIMSAVRQPSNNDMKRWKERGSPEDSKPRIKVERMKIGKWLAAIEKSALNMIEYYDEFGQRPDIDFLGTGEQKYADEGAKEKWEKIKARAEKLLSYITTRAFETRFRVDDIKDVPAKIRDLQKYWAENADYIKKNPEGTKSAEDVYSIVITRHPIDVLRMSDFDNISSCHSPASRTGGSPDSYYKCAVAEAHGHGAVAYIINNDSLKEAFGTPDLDEIGDASDFQENELFWDEERDAGLIDPISRIRLRQVRYYDTDTPKRWDEGTQIAVPEKRVYGKKIPGFRESFMKWARNSQEQQILNAPNDESGDLDLNKFVKFGGSYEDNNISSLVSNLFGPLRLQGAVTAVGRIKQNTDTEDELDLNLVGTAAEALENEAKLILDRYSFDNFEVEVTVDHDDEAAAWIEPEVRVKFAWASDDWYGLPSSIDLRAVANELADSYGDDYDILSAYGTYADARDGMIRLSFAVNVQALSQHEHGAFWSAYDFEEFLDTLYAEERYGGKVGMLVDFIEKYMKREEYMKGGAMGVLGRKIENGELTSYEWELEAEEDYDGGYELVSATTEIGFSYEGVPLNIVKKIFSSRDFWIKLRRQMHIPIHMKSWDKKYYVNIERDIENIDEEEQVIELKLNYHVGDSDPDEVSKIFEDIIETWDDEDELVSLVSRVFKSFIPEVSKLTQVDPISDLNQEHLNENKKVSGDTIFNNWRRFLNS